MVSSQQLYGTVGSVAARTAHLAETNDPLTRAASDSFVFVSPPVVLPRPSLYFTRSHRRGAQSRLVAAFSGPNIAVPFFRFLPRQILCSFRVVPTGSPSRAFSSHSSLPLLHYLQLRALSPAVLTPGAVCAARSTGLGRRVGKRQRRQKNQKIKNGKPKAKHAQLLASRNATAGLAASSLLPLRVFVNS